MEIRNTFFKTQKIRGMHAGVPFMKLFFGNLQVPVLPPARKNGIKNPDGDIHGKTGYTGFIIIYAVMHTYGNIPDYR